MKEKPLTGINVLEIGNSVAAPFAGMILGELGASVLKIERPKRGDYARDWGPPFIGGSAATFHAFNRSKRSVQVDLSDANNVESLRDHIVSDIDVVIHNLKFGGLKKLGLDPDYLLRIKPRLVLCDILSYGEKGPLKNRPGYDPVMQAMCGLMSIIGQEDASPSRIPVSMVDMTTGMWSVITVLAALSDRARTGTGGRVSTSLYETAISMMSVPVANYLADGRMPTPLGSGIAEVCPSRAYETMDGHILVAAGNDSLFKRLAEVIGMPRLADDSRFRRNSDRVQHRHELDSLLERAFKTRRAADWESEMSNVSIPCGPVQTIDQLLSHPQTQALGTIQSSSDGEVQTVGLPIRFSGVCPKSINVAPILGSSNSLFSFSVENGNKR